jgi:hypothetical protein
MVKKLSRARVMRGDKGYADYQSDVPSKFDVRRCKQSERL